MENRGQINEYMCRSCGTGTHTINLCHGTTPFGIACPKCNHPDSLSSFYKLTRRPIVTHAFYRPAKLPDDAAIADFILRGALICDALDKVLAEIMHGDPVLPDMEIEVYMAAIAEKYRLPIDRVRHAVNPYGI